MPCLPVFQTEADVASFHVPYRNAFVVIFEYTFLLMEPPACDLCTEDATSGLEEYFRPNFLSW